MFNSNIPGTLLTGSYNWGFVLLSYMVAVFASYTALNLAVKISASKGTNKNIWLTVCAFTLATGCWALHFIGMLAFQLPVAISYDIGTTLLSLGIILFSAGIAFHTAGTAPSPGRWTLSGLILGIGIAAMHYTGMAALTFEGELYFTPTLFVLSLFLALVAGIAVVWMIMKRVGVKNLPENHLLTFNWALILAGAFSAMHYTAMASTVFKTEILAIPEIPEGNNVLTLVIIIFTLIIFGISIVYSLSQKQALIKERQNFFNMLDSLPVCFHLQAPDYSIPFANKMFRERFMEPRQNPCYALMHQRSSPCDTCSTFNVFDTHENVYSVWESPDQNTYLTVCTPFKDIDGSDLVMEMAVDITEQKNSEKELLLAKEEAERSSKAKSQFLSQMSHELRTPLNAIMGFSQLMLLDPGSRSVEETKDNARLIYQAGENLLQLVNNVLDLSTIESGKTELCLENFSPLGPINDLMSLLQPLAGNYQVKLINTIHDDNLLLYADQARFK